MRRTERADHRSIATTIGFSSEYDSSRVLSSDFRDCFMTDWTIPQGADYAPDEPEFMVSYGGMARPSNRHFWLWSAHRLDLAPNRFRPAAPTGGNDQNTERLSQKLLRPSKPY